MMSMKSYSKMMMMLAMSGVFMDMGGSPSVGSSDDSKGYDKLTDQEKSLLMGTIRHNRIQLLLKKGCKEFRFPGITIIARNEKNADRKYANYLKLKAECND